MLLPGGTMNSSDQTDDDSERLSVRVKKYRNRLDEITNPKNLAQILYLDRNLSREEFDRKVIEIGYRAALRKLVSEACNGDIKALDLFLKRCDLHFSKTRKVEKEDDAQVFP